MKEQMFSIRNHQGYQIKLDRSGDEANSPLRFTVTDSHGVEQKIAQKNPVFLTDLPESEVENIKALKEQIDTLPANEQPQEFAKYLQRLVSNNPRRITVEKNDQSELFIRIGDYGLKGGTGDKREEAGLFSFIVSAVGVIITFTVPGGAAVGIPMVIQGGRGMHTVATAENFNSREFITDMSIGFAASAVGAGVAGALLPAGAAVVPELAQAASLPGINLAVEGGKAVLAETGKAVLAETGKAVLAETGKAVLAETGKAVLAETGKAVLAETGKAVLAETGKAAVAETGKSMALEVAKHGVDKAAKLAAQKVIARGAQDVTTVVIQKVGEKVSKEGELPEIGEVYLAAVAAPVAGFAGEQVGHYVGGKATEFASRVMGDSAPAFSNYVVRTAGAAAGGAAGGATAQGVSNLLRGEELTDGVKEAAAVGAITDGLFAISEAKCRGEDDLARLLGENEALMEEFYRDVPPGSDIEIDGAPATREEGAKAYAAGEKVDYRKPGQKQRKKDKHKDGRKAAIRDARNKVAAWHKESQEYISADLRKVPKPSRKNKDGEEDGSERVETLASLVLGTAGLFGSSKEPAEEIDIMSTLDLTPGDLTEDKCATALWSKSYDLGNCEVNEEKFRGLRQRLAEFLENDDHIPLTIEQVDEYCRRNLRLSFDLRADERSRNSM